MSLLSELADYLTTQGVATSGQIHLDWLPEGGDPVLSLQAHPGGAGERAFGQEGIKFENPNVQVITRGVELDSSTPEQLAWDAHDALAKLEATSLGSTPYLITTMLQSPSKQPLGPDENNRFRYSFNVNIRKEPS